MAINKEQAAKEMQEPIQKKERLPILVEREKEYGSFINIAVVSGELKGALLKGLSESLSISTQAQRAVISEALNMIGTKLARITQNPKHKDSWRDIIGYCTLVLEELEF